MGTGPQAEPVFHAELRQFPGVARRFNLSWPELYHEIVGPWLDGLPVELDDRKFVPDRTKLRIIAGPPIRLDEIGMGRGWSTVEKHGEDATERILAAVRAQAGHEAPAATTDAGTAHAAPSGFKARLLDACRTDRIALHEVVALTAAEHLGARASERLAIAEATVWELLHEGRLALYADGEQAPLARDRWQGVVLSWESWSDGSGGPRVGPPPNSSH